MWGVDVRCWCEVLMWGVVNRSLETSTDNISHNYGHISLQKFNTHHIKNLLTTCHVNYGHTSHQRFNTHAILNTHHVMCWPYSTSTCHRVTSRRQPHCQGVSSGCVQRYEPSDAQEHKTWLNHANITTAMLASAPCMWQAAHHYSESCVWIARGRTWYVDVRGTWTYVVRRHTTWERWIKQTIRVWHQKLAEPSTFSGTLWAFSSSQARRSGKGLF